jgi:glycosyltransferase involved in cell wall biosynthesis
MQASPDMNDERTVRVAHVTTVDMSLRYLLLHQLGAIRQAGFEVTGVSAPGPHTEALRRAGVRHLPVPMTRSFSPLRDLIALVALVRAFRHERFTLVHTHTPKGGLLGQYAALIAGVPLRVHTIHGLYFPAHASSRLRSVFALIERVTMAFSAHNFCQNPEDVTRAIELGICKKERIELIGNGIDLTEFDPARYSASRREAIRRALGLNPEHLVVGAVGRLVREKGYVELLQAAGRVRRVFPNVRFLAVGGSELDKPDAVTPALASEMGVADVVQFLGHRDDVADLYAIMDLFVLPSHREGFPRAPMEAAALGVASVLTDIRGCRETVAHESTGLLVPVKDQEALASAIIALLQDEPKRRRFGVAARQKAIAEFDEHRVFERVLAGYRRLLAQQGITLPAQGEPAPRMAEELPRDA